MQQSAETVKSGDMSVLTIFEIIQIMSERRKVKARIERQRSEAGGSPFVGFKVEVSEDEDHHDHDDNVYMTMMMTNQHDHMRMIIHIIKCSHMFNMLIHMTHFKLEVMSHCKGVSKILTANEI